MNSGAKSTRGLRDQGPVALTAVGLCKSYGPRRVVDNLSLEIRPGEIVGLLGPNGAGKTTTFKIILGLLGQDSGTVRFGASLDGLPLYRRARCGLGYLPQGPSVFRGMKVRDNLLAVLEALGSPHPRRRADVLINRFELNAVATQRASSLSGGERRRLEFARAICSAPKILLCDEPFSGVDPIAVSEIGGVIRDLAADGVGILLTDHNVRDTLAICHRVYVIAGGRIISKGIPDEVVSEAAARQNYFGDAFEKREGL